MCCMCRGLLEKLAILFALILARSVNTIGEKAGSGGYFPDDDEDGCSDGEYLCSVSRSCIPDTRLCDTKNDCGNWEDELESMCGSLANCPNGCYNGGTCRLPGTCTCTVDWSGSSCTIPLCPAGCLNGGNCSSPGICTCPTGWAGNDCRQDITECAGDHGCHHLCNNTDGSFHCYCNPGYMLHSNGTTCIDINECLVDNGGCEFSCTNLEGINNTTGLGYQCGCDNGYQLTPNNHNCSDVGESDDSFSTEATIAISVVVAFIIIIILIITPLIIIAGLYCKYQLELKKKYKVDNNNVNNVNESVNSKQKDLCGDSITMVPYETVTVTNDPATTADEADTDLGYHIAISVNKVDTDSNYETMTTDETDADPACGSLTVNIMHTETAPKTVDANKIDTDPAYGTVNMYPANKMDTDSVYIAPATSAYLHNY